MVERIEDQPPPVARACLVSVQALVRADLEERELVGIERYGTPLQPHNGRDALVDAYQEALDLACYLRQAIEEAPARAALEQDLETGMPPDKIDCFGTRWSWGFDAQCEVWGYKEGKHAYRPAELAERCGPLRTAPTKEVGDA